ncbi:blue copper protein 1a-like [Rhododendron vialii]|uniref:blue copper protein 1a-like n=1 Tax=Rhododendron vialii TaxID=182163 RepID=UPI00265F9AA5|nr:blue copper protein 1a-like [Rhododendron vialii]
MAYWKILVALAIFAVAFPSTLATQWTVGGSAEWNLNVSYVEWAAKQTFVVGDSLVFNYKPGTHNVIKVSVPDYVSCTIPVGAVPLTTGDDVIQLQTPGNHSYICGISNHCTLGMRLLIFVSGEASPSPAPSSTSGGGITELAPPPSAATGIIASWKCHAWVVGVFSILMMIMA